MFSCLLLQNYDVGISGETGRLYYINNNDDDGNTLSLKLDQNFMWYNSSDGHNKNSSQASGAYIFRSVDIRSAAYFLDITLNINL